MPFLFSHVEYCDMHYVYGYCDGNASAAVNKYRRRYPEREFHQNAYLPVFSRHCVTMVVFRALLCILKETVRTINTRENIRDMAQKSPRLSTRRMASRVGLTRMNVWRTLHEENLYPYHDRRVKHLEPGDHAQRLDLCHWVTAHSELCVCLYPVALQPYRALADRAAAAGQRS